MIWRLWKLSDCMNARLERLAEEEDTIREVVDRIEFVRRLRADGVDRRGIKSILLACTGHGTTFNRDDIDQVETAIRFAEAGVIEDDGDDDDDEMAHGRAPGAD